MNPIAPPSAGMPRKSWSVRCKILSTLATTVALIVVVAIASVCRSSSALAAPRAATAPTTSAPAVTHARTMSAAVPTHKAQLSAPHVLIKMSGNGQGSSAPFLVTTSTVTATYTYNCSASGGSGNFIADMVYGDQASPNSDDQVIANALGTGGSATVTLYPTNVGQDYHLTVISECTWTVTLTTSVPAVTHAPTTSARAVTHAPTTSAAVPAHKAQLSAPHVLIKMSGNGQGSSAPFLVTTSTVTATYTYNCSASGGSGNFIADMVYGDQASPNSDDQVIANALGTGGSATVTLYPTNVGQDYHLTVISECTWTVTLTTSVPAVTHAPTTSAPAVTHAPTTSARAVTHAPMMSARCPRIRPSHVSQLPLPERRVRDSGSPAPAGSVEQGGYRARADGATALADREGLAGVERDRLAERDGDLHRLPW